VAALRALQAVTAEELVTRLRAGGAKVQRMQASSRVFCLTRDKHLAEFLRQGGARLFGEYTRNPWGYSRGIDAELVHEWDVIIDSFRLDDYDPRHPEANALQIWEAAA